MTDQSTASTTTTSTSSATAPSASPQSKLPADVLTIPACLLCDGCGLEKPRKELKRCTWCQRVYYCGRECQRLHWPAHKIVCYEKDPSTVQKRINELEKLSVELGKKFRVIHLILMAYKLNAYAESPLELADRFPVFSGIKMRNGRFMIAARLEYRHNIFLHGGKSLVEKVTSWDAQPQTLVYLFEAIPFSVNFRSVVHRLTFELPDLSVPAIKERHDTHIHMARRLLNALLATNRNDICLVMYENNQGILEQPVLVSRRGSDVLFAQGGPDNLELIAMPSQDKLGANVSGDEEEGSVTKHSTSTDKRNDADAEENQQ